MTNSVLEWLNQQGRYHHNDLLLFEKELKPQTFNKGDILLKQGEVCSSAYFMIEGAVYQHRTNTQIEADILDLHLPHEWVLNHQSFISRKPSTYTIQAFEATNVYQISIDAIHGLITKSPAFFQLGKILDIAKPEEYVYGNQYTPDEKYLHLLHHKPQVIQTFPLKMIASYLNMTPETLSRVRRRLLEGGID